jgi:hypothetical protein
MQEKTDMVEAHGRIFEEGETLRFEVSFTLEMTPKFHGSPVYEWSDRELAQQLHLWIPQGTLLYDHRLLNVKVQKPCECGGCRLRRMDKIICALCGEPAPAVTAHLHAMGWVGDDCCWDERLRSTE